jgi:PAS domain-containing protein
MMSLLKKSYQFLQRVLKQIIHKLLKLTVPQVAVLFITVAVLVSMVIVLTIDFLWDGRFNTEMEFAGVVTTFLDGLLIIGLLVALLSELREEVKRHKLSQKELELKNTILKTQQETSLDAILVVDENGKIVSYNQQFTDTYGGSPRSS